MIDTHAHLNIEIFESDIKKVVEHARLKHIQNIICIGMEKQSNLKAIELAKKFSIIYPTVGIHPGYVDDDQDIKHLEGLIQTEKVIAVGECGIDLYWRKDNFDLQKKIFIRQIELSIKYQLPLVIHMRSSFNEIYEILKPYQGQVKGVFHCFSSHVEDAKKAIDLGFYIGIDGPVTFKNSEELKRVVQAIDLEYILIETDSPYLAPHPYRGKRNEPAYLSYIVDAIADLKEVTKDVVITQTTENAKKLFKIGGQKT